VTSPPSRIPIAEIREAARLAVETQSLRAVAREIKLSPMGLRNFLDGREPYSATRRKLNAWFVEHAATRPEYEEAAVRASLAVLLEGIPESQRDTVARELLDFLESEYVQNGARPPAWLKRLRNE
jgi:hypothetical protein